MKIINALNVLFPHGAENSFDEAAYFLIQ